MNQYIVPAALTALILFIAHPLSAGNNTLLLKAVSVRHQDIADYSRKTIPRIQQCLDAGADIGARNVLGRNAVHILLESHSGILKAETRDVLAYLIKRGADVNASDCYGMTPLHIVKDLLKKTRDSIGNCTNCGWMERNIDDMSKTLEMLRKAGATAGEQPFGSARNEITPEPPAIPGGNDPDGMLIRAVEAGDHAEVKRAVSRGACVDCFYHMKSEYENQYIYTTPLRRAAQRADVMSVAILLNHGADPNNFDIFIMNRLDDERNRRIVKLHIDAGLKADMSRYTSVHARTMTRYQREKNPHLMELNDLIKNIQDKIGYSSDMQPIKDPDVLFHPGNDIDPWKAVASRYANRAMMTEQWDLFERFIDNGILPHDSCGSLKSYFTQSRNPKKIDYFLRAVHDSRCAHNAAFTLTRYPGGTPDTVILSLISTLFTMKGHDGSIPDINATKRIYLGDYGSPGFYGIREVSLLMTAAAYGKDDLARLLISKGAVPGMKNGDGESALSFAAAGGKTSTAKLLIQAGADIDSRNSRGVTPLMTACHHGHAEAVRLLTESGADVNARDETSWTPLIYAAHSGNEALVSFLLDRGADAGARGSDGMSPLVMALREGNGRVADMLRRRGAKEDGTHGTRLANHLLLLAAETGRPQLLSKALGKGADINCPDFAGRTPIFLASMNGHLETARILVKAGADVKKQCIDGSSPLHAALLKSLKISHVWHGSESGYPQDTIAMEFIELLLSAGADINSTDRRGRTPLFTALSKYKADHYMIQHLLDAGAGVNLADERGMTPLMNCAAMAAMGYHDYNYRLDLITNSLLGAGARPNDCTSEGVTALMIFVHSGRINDVARLLKAGSDPEKRTNGGLRAIDFAKTPNMIRYLLSRGVSPTHGSSRKLGKFAVNKRQYHAAREYLEKALKIKETSPALNDLGYVYMRMKDYGKAEKALLRSVKLDAVNPLPRYNLACLNSMKGKTGPALEWLKKSIRLGFRDRSYLLNDRDLAAVRRSPRFQELLKTALRETPSGLTEIR